MSRHLTKSELLEGFSDILASPKDGGELLGIVVRPESGRRVEPESVAVSFAGGPRAAGSRPRTGGRIRTCRSAS